MKQLTAKDLKAIMMSRRAHIFYLEYCRVLVNGGRVEYVTDSKRAAQYWNIPLANTTTILLGTGTSITQAAMRDLSRAGVVVGFCGGGGTPLFSAGEADLDIDWQLPQSEYRETQYLQRWCQFWFDESLRLNAAKYLQNLRLDHLLLNWTGNPHLKAQQWAVDLPALQQRVEISRQIISKAPNQQHLLTEEGRLTDFLYAQAVRCTGFTAFEKRAKNGTGLDIGNQFLDHGNYLAYGLAASALWTMGIPHAFPVLHGKTRRGALVFDIADIVKDSLILPQAFLAARDGLSANKFRQLSIEILVESQALDTMIESIKLILNHVNPRQKNTQITTV